MSQQVRLFKAQSEYADKIAVAVSIISYYTVSLMIIFPSICHFLTYFFTIVYSENILSIVIQLDGKK